MRSAVACTILMLVVMAANGASAQEGTDPTSATNVFKADIEAVLNSPNGGIDRQIKVADIGTSNVAVGVLHRGATGDSRRQPSGIMHAQVTEVYYVLSGSGTLVTGANAASPREVRRDSEIVRVAVGPSFTGAFEGDSDVREVSEGDVVVIPAGVYHGWSNISDHVTYLSIRPDPDKVLPAGYVNPAVSR